MTLAPRRRLEARPEPEDLIREARQRQRRRQAVIAFATAALLGSAAWATSELGGGRSDPTRPLTRHKTATLAPRTAAAVPLIRGAGTSLLMWPVGPASFTSAGGPPSFFEDLGTGRVRSSARPAISAGDYQPLLARIGRWLVYVGDGTTAIRADLRGQPRVLAATPFFAPAADPGRVWLFRPRTGNHGPVIRAWTAAVGGGQPSRAVTLPAGAYLPAVRGTDAGLLLQARHGLALWQPGGALRPLPYSPSSDGFDATSRLVAYGTNCASHVTNASLSFEPGAGYDACRMLRIFNVVTGKLTSIAVPTDTVGWVPNGFGLVSALSPQGTMIAAYAAVRPAGSGRVRLYVLRTRGAAAKPRLVPSSTAFLYARTAWSVRGDWLLYQDPGMHLRAYQPSTGKWRNSTTPCCRYTVMVSMPSGHAPG